MTSLTPEELLTTTRAVRKRLDLEKPVEIELVKKMHRNSPAGTDGFQ